MEFLWGATPFLCRGLGPTIGRRTGVLFVSREVHTPPLGPTSRCTWTVDRVLDKMVDGGTTRVTPFSKQYGPPLSSSRSPSTPLQNSLRPCNPDLEVPMYLRETSSTRKVRPSPQPFSRLHSTHGPSGVPVLSTRVARTSSFLWV